MIAQAVAIGLLVSWFCAAAMGQLLFSTRASRLTRFPLIPRWNFFAPTPGTLDMWLFYRHKLCDNSLSSWTQICLAPRSPIAYLWNPTRRLHKALFDIGQELCRPSAQNDDEHRVLRVPYLVTLNIVVNEARPPNAVKVQFALIAREERFGLPGFEELFRSRFHDL
jgi:hypothetical protein